jgi:hypothetical protein
VGRSVHTFLIAMKREKRIFTRREHSLFDDVPLRRGRDFFFNETEHRLTSRTFCVTSCVLRFRTNGSATAVTGPHASTLFPMEPREVCVHTGRRRNVQELQNKIRSDNECDKTKLQLYVKTSLEVGGQQFEHLLE